MKQEEELSGISAAKNVKIPALREIIEERKAIAVDTISVNYAKNRLPLEEYERLVEYINKIESERELAIVEKIVAEYDEKPRTVYRDAEQDDYDDETENDDNSDIPGKLSILSSRTYSGPVRSGTQLISILGDGVIKIRKADLRKKRTVINVLTILGDVRIQVEPGIHVTNKSLAILADSKIDNKIFRQSTDKYPEIVIKGTILLGDLSVKLLKDQE